MKKIMNKFKRWLGDADRIDAQCKQAIMLSREANDIAREAERVIRDRTEVHIDVHQRRGSAHQVVMIGQYKNRDYVKTYQIPTSLFNDLINELQDIEKHASITTVDAMWDISASIAHELNTYTPPKRRAR